MKLKTISAIAITLTLFAFKGDKPAYTIYDSKGKESNYDDMLKDAKDADIILFGELHDNPIIHWLEFELTKDVYADKKNNLIMGAEMFEADDQIALTEYLQGKITDKTLKDEVKLWPNYKTDYKPLVEFAKSKHLPFVADNIPRRYANIVYNKGLVKLDSIDPEAKKWMCPLPFKYDAELKCYKEINEAAGEHCNDNLPISQAIKDATMAYFILKNWKQGKTYIHFNGSYHSNYHQGIEWYLKLSNPNLKVFTIGANEQAGLDTLAKDAYKMANYIICTPESMTKTQQ